MIVSGAHAIEAVLSRGGASGVLLVARKTRRIQDLAALAEKAGVTVREVEESELDGLAPRERHRGVLFSGSTPRGQGAGLSERAAAAEADALFLLLDGVTDPQNYGAILRSADQFAVDLVITTRRRSAKQTPTVLGTSAGAAQWVDTLAVPNLTQAIKQLQEHGFWVYGAAAEGPPAEETDLRGKVALVMGSEGEGLHDLVRRSCDALISIPTRGHIDSLNVSVASGILLYEVRRQQRTRASRKR